MLGGRPYASLPGYLKGLDAALLPNRLNKDTRSMFPMKFFEYLAAGRQVVSVRLPALAEYEELAIVCDDAPSFVDGIAAVLAGGGPSLEQRLAVARQHTYAIRTDKMMAVLERTLAMRGRREPLGAGSRICRRRRPLSLSKAAALIKAPDFLPAGAGRRGARAGSGGSARRENAGSAKPRREPGRSAGRRRGAGGLPRPDPGATASRLRR